jgi:CTP:molybdopterin cytidylyltransferase MocA
VIAAVVLAAGSGSRFGPGTPKVVAPLAGVPILQRVLQALRQPPVGRVVVVLGYAADQVRAAVDLTGVDVVINPLHASGQASSVAAGLAALPVEAEAAVIAMGDQPGITPGVVAALVAGYRKALRPIVVPTYGGERGTPVLLARPVFGPMAALEGDVGARAIMERHPRWVHEVAADGLADPRDVDTPEDLRVLAGGAS